MTACNRPGCGGTVDETGFCDTCWRRPVAAPARPVTARGLPGSTVPADPSAPCGAGCTRSSGAQWTVAGLVSLPVSNPPDPTSRIISTDEPVAAGRRCGKDGCTGRLGVPHAGQPARMTGFCPKCRTPYSFRPKLHPGDLVAGQYEVLGSLAQSGFGWVYLGKDRHLDDNFVVLKGLINANDSHAAEMAVRERQYLTRLSHPNIVRIFNAVTHTDPLTGEHTGYIVMEYVHGPTLDEVRSTALRCGNECARLPLEHILAMGHEILSALDYLHGRGLLYNDMKPDNVIRGRDRITVIDLGAVCEIAAQNRSPVGTPPYQVDPKEIKSRGVTVRSDIHTVGRTLDRLLPASVDRSPEIHPGEAAVVAVESFRKLTKRAGAADPDRRFASAAEMSEQLTGVLRELLSLRERREHAAASTLFAATAVLIDGGFGGVPGLERWTAPAQTRPMHVAPPGREAALGLPLPRVDPADPAARFIADGALPDPSDLISLLASAGDDSAELWLRGARAHLELDDRQEAMRCLDKADTLLAGGAAHWRVSWYRGLCALAREDLPAAKLAFAEVRDTWPGEPAPKLALGLCEEGARRPEHAERFLAAVWLRDRSHTSAAFGLARLRLAVGDRSGAAEVLDEVPLMSPHRDAARIAAFRAFIETLGPVGGAAAGPDSGDLQEAAARLRGLHLDGGEPDGDARRRLTALIRQAALNAPLRPAAIDADGEVLGRPCTEDGLRRLLERSFRDLARQARTAAEHAALVDLANSVRPRTLLTGWRG